MCDPLNLLQSISPTVNLQEQLTYLGVQQRWCSIFDRLTIQDPRHGYDWLSVLLNFGYSSHWDSQSTHWHWNTLFAIRATWHCVFSEAPALMQWAQMRSVFSIVYGKGMHIRNWELLRSILVRRFGYCFRSEILLELRILRIEQRQGSVVQKSEFT